MRECTCKPTEFPFYCERHKVRKSARWVRYCQTRDGFWEAWEDGHGPGQFKDGHQPQRRNRKGKARTGPGTELKKILAKFGIFSKGGCHCKQMAAFMDLWGPDGCEEKMPRILEHLKTEADKRNLGIIYSEWIVEKLVRWAIRRARKKEKSNG